MSINVTCPGCHSRFKVSDKFAGKTGPCPKCKKPMKVPEKDEEVVIHAPVQGPKDSTGKAVLDPIKREEVKVSKVMIVGIVAVSLLTPLLAWVLGKTMGFEAEGAYQQPLWLLGVGALLVAPFIVWAGYTFLRNDELAPYRGQALMKRVALCAVIYAALWGLHWYMGNMLYGDEVSLPETLIAIPVLLIPGALASLVTLDLDGVSAGMHFGFYLLVTVGLRMLMGLPPL